MNMKNIFLVLALFGMAFAAVCPTIDAPGTYVVGVTPPVDDIPEGCGVEIAASDVILDCNGNTLDGPGSGAGVSVNGYDRVTVKNCDITEFETGIRIQNSNNNEILDNNLHGNGGFTSGIYLLLSDSNLISGNEIWSNGDHGIHLDGSSHNTIDDNNVSDHTHGIFMNLLCDSPCILSNYNTITNNWIFENGYGISMYSSSHNTIDKNEINDNDDKGIIMYRDMDQSCDYNTITNNDILRNGAVDTGIMNWYGDNNYIATNNISDNGGAGIRMGGTANDNVIHDNTITGNHMGVRLEVEKDDYPTRNNITNNDILDNTGDSPDAGVYLDGTIETHVYQNVIKYNDWSPQAGVVVLNGEDDVLEDNEISYNNYYGVFVYESTGTQILDNEINFNEESGVKVRDSENILVNGNTIKGNNAEGDKCGVYVDESTVTITENTICGNEEYGIYTSLSDPESDYPTIEDNTFCIDLLNPEDGYLMEEDPEDVEFVFDYSNVIPYDERPGTIYGNCTLYVNIGGIDVPVATWTYDDLRFGTTQGYEYSDLPFAYHYWYVECEDDSNNRIDTDVFTMWTEEPEEDETIPFNPNGGSDTQDVIPGVISATVTGPGSVDMDYQQYGSDPSGSSTSFVPTGFFFEVNMDGSTESVCFEITLEKSVVDAAGIDPNTIKIWHFNPKTGKWSSLSTTVTTSGGNYILTACTNQFSLFAVGGYQFSSSGDAKRTMDISYEVLCPDNKVEVTVTDGGDPESNIDVRIIGTNPWIGTVAESDTDADGKVTFELTTSGTYELEGSRSGYKKESVVFDFEICDTTEEPAAEPEEPAEEPEEETPPEEEPEETSDEMEAATTALSEAESAIEAAKAAGKDTSAAEAKLQEAEQAFHLENFAEAKQLAEEAKALLEAAAPAPVEEETPPATEEEPAAEPEEEPEPAPEPTTDNGWILWLIVLVVVVGAGYWYFTQPKGKGSRKK